MKDHNKLLTRFLRKNRKFSQNKSFVEKIDSSCIVFTKQIDENKIDFFLILKWYT